LSDLDTGVVMHVVVCVLFWCVDAYSLFYDVTHCVIVSFFFFKQKTAYEIVM